MFEIPTAGLDLAKNVFRVHASSASGRAVFRKKLRRDQVLASFSRLPRCVVAMEARMEARMGARMRACGEACGEACGGAHFWGREIGRPGHEVRPIPPAGVKPFVKRQKNGAAGAEARLAEPHGARRCVSCP